MQCHKHKKSFTLIELLVVISIIGLLASTVFAALGSARVRARDTVRKQHLQEIMKALQVYYVGNNTYQVAGSGYDGCSCGWYDYQDSGHYALAVAQALANAGDISYVSHVTPGQYYMIYHPWGATSGVCLYAKLENPSAEDLATYAAQPYNLDVYGMNYARCYRN